MKKHFTLLVVDDDPDDRDLFFDAVKEIDGNCQCLSAENGEEALALLRGKNANLPDFIFLDQNMPRMNGREFLTEIKKDSNLYHLPVVIYSTSKRPEDVTEMAQLGAFAFIAKPLTFDGICNAISTMITGTMSIAH
ncbi:MAG TPA: response regulator [Chitinophagales bacterium]|nr:response regulator [Chitinophagales bacterium]